jgi:putative endonuclease
MDRDVEFMSLIRKHTGARGEALAAAYLTDAGYRVVECNYRCQFGEIDIVAWDGATLVFVEVKCRHSEAYGAPQLAVGMKKQNRISKVALHYVAEKHLQNRPARFDVVAVLLLPSETRIELIRGAFEMLGS